MIVFLWFVYTVAISGPPKWHQSEGGAYSDYSLHMNKDSIFINDSNFVYMVTAWLYICFDELILKREYGAIRMMQYR